MNLTPAVERLDALRDCLDRLARAGRVGGWPAPLIGAATALGASLEDLAGALDSAADWPQARALLTQARETLPAAFQQLGRAVAENLAAGVKLRAPPARGKR